MSSSIVSHFLTVAWSPFLDNGSLRSRLILLCLVVAICLDSVDRVKVVCWTTEAFSV